MVGELGYGIRSEKIIIDFFENFKIPVFLHLYLFICSLYSYKGYPVLVDQEKENAADLYTDPPVITLLFQ